MPCAVLLQGETRAVPMTVSWFKHILFQIVKYKNEKGLGRAGLLSEPSPGIHTRITQDPHL